MIVGTTPSLFSDVIFSLFLTYRYPRLVKFSNTSSGRYVMLFDDKSLRKECTF